MEQQCNKCGESKPIVDFARNSAINKTSGLPIYPSGHGKTCKICASIASQQRKKSKKALVAEAGVDLNAKEREKYQEKKEKKAEQSRLRYAANKEKISAQRKANREAHPERFKKYVEDSHARHPETRQKEIDARHMRERIARLEAKAVELKQAKKDARKLGIKG